MAVWFLLVKDAEIFLELLSMRRGGVVWTQCLMPAKMEQEGGSLQTSLRVVCSLARAAGTSGEPTWSLRLPWQAKKSKVCEEVMLGFTKIFYPKTWL